MNNNVTEESDIISNFDSEIEQTIVLYETSPAKGLCHGFQKDAIQNGWGHRLNKKGENWKMLIKYLKNEHGEFVIVEDCGNTGLIGKNYSRNELSEMMANKVKLGPEEKLARFSTLYNSGGNVDSAGLFGRGKWMYQTVSKNYEIYFDSLTSEGKYISNHRTGSKIIYPSCEGDDAKLLIKEKTGLDEKTTTGTRVIICNPKKEVVDYILSKKILDDTNETWWRIFEKYNAIIEVYNNDELLGVGEVPEIYKKYYGNEKYCIEYPKFDVTPGYRVKRIKLFYTEEDEEIPEDLGNISYYRNDMKIGDIYSIDSLPVDEKYRKRLGGFVELEQEWEKEMENNENLTHYGPKLPRLTSFQNIKKATKSHLEEFLIAKGLKKKETRVDPDKNLKELAYDLTDFLKDCDIKIDWDALKSTKNTKPLSVECKKSYPNEGKRTVEFDQEMKFKYVIDKLVADKEFEVKILLYSEDGNISEYLTQSITIDGNKYESEEIIIPYSAFYEETRNVVKVSVVSKTNVNSKNSCTFPVYAGIDEIVDKSDIEFKIKNIIFPDDKSRTVLFNQDIKDIVVSITNNTNKDIIVSVSGFVQDVYDRNNTIEEIYRNNALELNSGCNLDVEVGDIHFGEKYMSRKGPMKIKFKLAHISGLDLEKGEIISEFGITILYEEEQKDETINPFITGTYHGDKYEKSKLELKNGTYFLDFNLDYIFYRDIPEDNNEFLYKLYFAEDMIKAIIQIKLQNEDYSIINCDKDTVEELLEWEIYERASNATIKYLGQYFEVRG